MGHIIQPASRAEIVEFELSFEYPGTGAGYGFTCDANGVIDETNLSPEARANLARCRAGEDGLAGRLIDLSRTEREPALFKCDCGENFYLDDAFINTCGCGRDYDGKGSLLAPRSQWGEETGETWVDIVGPSRPGDFE